MPTGKVKFFDAYKGFGFIEVAGQEDDVFFHIDDIDGPEPSEGQSLDFTVEQAPRGPRAKNIKFE